MSAAQSERDELPPREIFAFYALFWLASMVLITCGLFTFGHHHAASGVAQVALGIAIGVAGMALVDLGTPRE